MDFDHYWCPGGHLEESLEVESGLGGLYQPIFVDLSSSFHCLAWGCAGHTPPCVDGQHPVCAKFLALRAFITGKNLHVYSSTIYKIECPIL